MYDHFLKELMSGDESRLRHALRQDGVDWFSMPRGRIKKPAQVTLTRAGFPLY